MKKRYLLQLFCVSLISIGFCGNALAGPFANSGTLGGDDVEIESTDADRPDMVFTPSPKVWVTGGTSVDSFAASAVHLGSQEKTGGQAYGMASDTNQLFWSDVSADGHTAVTATGSSAFSDWKN